MKIKKIFDNYFKDEKFSEIATGSVFSLGARAIAMFCGLGVNVIIARFYGADVIGVVSLINTYLMIVTIFALLGTNTSILRFIPEHVSKYSFYSAFKVYRKTLSLIILLSIILSVSLWFAGDIIADKVFSKPHLGFFFSLASIFVVFVVMQDFFLYVLRGLKKIKTFAFLQLLRQLINILFLGVITIVVYRKYTPIYIQFLTFFLTALTGLILVEYSFNKSINENHKINNISIFSILKVSLPMFLTKSMGFLISHIDVAMLGMFRTEEEIGYYAVAVKLATLTTFILQSINTMAAPKFSELYHQGKKEELSYVAKKSTKLIFWTTTPILGVLLIFGKIILTIFFGKDFKVAYLALVFLVFGQFINAISGSVSYFMNMTGNEKETRNMMLFALIINITLNYLLIPRYGIYGASFASMISVIFWNMLLVVKIKKKFGFSILYLPIKSI